MSRWIQIPVIVGVLGVGMSAAVHPSNASGNNGPASFSGGCATIQTSGDLDASQLGSYNQLLIQAPERLQATTDPSWGAGCAIRVEVHEGDVDSGSTDRAEFAGNKVLSNNGEEVWYAMSFMLDLDSPLPLPGQWMIVDQFFAQNIAERLSGGSPPLSIEVTPSGQARIYVRGGIKTSAAAPAPRENSYFLAPASPGVWHELLFHVKWSTGADGLVEVWQRASDGSFTSTPQISVSGPNVLSVAGDALPVYAETGIYRSRSAAVQVVYYGGLWARQERAEAEAFFPSSLPDASTSHATSTALSCSPQAIAVGQGTLCTVIVTDTAAMSTTSPSGQVRFSSSDLYSQFSDEGSCKLSQIPQSQSSSSCTLVYTPYIQPGNSAHNDLLEARYFPDGNVHTSSSASTAINVSAVPSELTAKENNLEQTDNSPAPTSPSLPPFYTSPPSTSIQPSPAPRPGPSAPRASNAARHTQSDLITNDAAIAHAVKRGIGKLGLRDPGGRLLRNLVIANTMITLEPGHYYDSLRITATLGRLHTIVPRDRPDSVIFERPLIAVERLTIGSAGLHRFVMRLTSLGSSILRQAQREGLDLRFSNFLSVNSDRGPAIMYAVPLSIRF